MTANERRRPGGNGTAASEHEGTQLISTVSCPETAVPRVVDQLALPILPGAPTAAADYTGVDQAAAGTDEWWRDGADRAVLLLAEQGRPFTVDDVRALGVAEPQGGASAGNAWGALLSGWHRRGVIRPVAAVPSQRRERHRGLIRQWQGVHRQPGSAG